MTVGYAQVRRQERSYLVRRCPLTAVADYARPDTTHDARMFGDLPDQFFEGERGQWPFLKRHGGNWRMDFEVLKEIGP
jgi:hypothetical protein